MFRWISAFFSYIGNVLGLQGRKMEKKANSVYTGSAEGIAAAFEEDEASAEQEYREFFEAVSAVEAEAVRQEKELDQYEHNIQDLEESLAGALDAIETAKAKGDKKTEEEATTDANDFAQELEGLKGKEEDLKQEIERGEPERNRLKKELVKLKEELASLPKAKAAAISKFLSKSKLIERNEKLAGIRNRRKERKSSMVEAELEQLDAQARVSSEMTGVATEDRRDKYKQAGQKTAASNKVADMLAQRAKARTQATGAVTTEAPAVHTGNGGDRPEAK